MKAVLAFDFHIPFHNVNFCAQFITHIYATQPNLIIIGGDFLDCYGISKFDSSPCRASNFEYERDCAVDLLKQIRFYAQNADIIFIKGNHEERLPKYLMRGKGASLYSLPELQIKNLLKLDELRIIYCEDSYDINLNTIATHGFRLGLNSAKSECLSYLVNGFSGHGHKDNWFKENYLKHTLEWYSVGCMADIEQIEYAIKFRHKWNNSFIDLEYDKNRLIKVETIRPEL